MVKIYWSDYGPRDIKTSWVGELDNGSAFLGRVIFNLTDWKILQEIVKESDREFVLEERQIK